MMRNSFNLQRQASPDPKAMESSMKRLRKQRRHLRRQIARVKLRARYDEVLASIVENRMSGFQIKQESVAQSLLRLRDLLHMNPPGETESSSDSECEEESAVTAPKVNYRALEVSHRYLLNEILEMIRTEYEENWRKKMSRLQMEEVQHAVGEVIRAFYCFTDLYALSEERYSAEEAK